MVRLRGDITLAQSRKLWHLVRPLLKRRDVDPLTLDFADARRLDSSAIALVSLLRRRLHADGRTLELVELSDAHEAALALAPPEEPPAARVQPAPGLSERVGTRVIEALLSARDLGRTAVQTAYHAACVITRRSHLPSGALTEQIAKMGADGIGIVGLLSFLLGMTMSFQGSVQLQRVGAGPFVADMIGVSMVRELAPLITAVILTGRTGAAIAAELGTMRVRSEIDALATMGINPVRYLLVPRIGGITIVGPALSLMAMGIGCLGGMLVAWLTLDLSPLTFWQRMVLRLTLLDFVHGIAKSFLFAWIIGFAGAHLGMRAKSDASSVGSATTRTVVVSIFFIIVVDAIFATATTLARYG